jgi:hypothetical protein
MCENYKRKPEVRIVYCMMSVLIALVIDFPIGANLGLL